MTLACCVAVSLASRAAVHADAAAAVTQAHPPTTTRRGVVPPLVPQPPVKKSRISFIPLPEVIVDPNEGTTVGVLPVLLLANEAKAVRSIIAPDVRYNDITGIFPTFRFFDYPTPKQSYFLIAGLGTKRGQDFEGYYAGEDLFGGGYDVRGGAEREEDPFERFYGYGNETASSSETNYTSRTNAARAFLGVNLPWRLQVSVRERLRQVQIGQGGVSSVTQLRDPSSGFTNIKGIDGATVIGTRFGIAYDTRDSTGIPTQGLFADASVEIVNRALGSSNSFVKYNLEGKAYQPLRSDKKFILAVHGVLDYLENGADTPFFEKSSVGGVHSLRGYGSNRFTDNNRAVFQAELRSNVYDRVIFGVRAHLEVAPFLDLAEVFNSSREFPFEHLHAVGGLGFRAVVIPQVVAYVDIGTAGGSPAAFTGIDYPF